MKIQVLLLYAGNFPGGRDGRGRFRRWHRPQRFPKPDSRSRKSFAVRDSNQRVLSKRIAVSFIFSAIMFMGVKTLNGKMFRS